LQLVRSRSTELASSVAEIRRAAGQAEGALARAYPTVDATGSVSQHLLLGTGVNFSADGALANQRIPDPSTLWNARLSARQPLLDLSVWHDVQTAHNVTRAARERTANLERLVLAGLADTIVSVVTAERLAEVSRIALRSSLSTLSLTRRRAELGAGSSVDVLRAEQEVALNRTQVVSSNESLLRAREALGLALGYPEPWGVTTEVRLDELGQDAARLCPALPSLDQRADVRAARADVEVARSQTRAADYRLAPRLDLVSDLSYQNSSNTANGRPVQWTIGALLSVPLYDGGARNAERVQSEAQQVVAEATLTQTQRQASLEVSQATRAVSVATTNHRLSFESRELARQTARLAELSFINGKGTSFELVDAARRHQQAELDLAVQEFEVVRARITALLANANCSL
jgi:outer membrane protein TolC